MQKTDTLCKMGVQKNTPRFRMFRFGLKNRKDKGRRDHCPSFPGRQRATQHLVLAYGAIDSDQYFLHSIVVSVSERRLPEV